jgi:alpha-1,6-mannosyltransferase
MYVFQRHEFTALFVAYAVCFCAYLYALKLTKTENDLNFFLKTAIILRGGILFAFPNLSDDVYRFIWDGHLTGLGENPFSHLPSYYIKNQLFTDVLTPELFSKLNSPNYFSVYPSVCQGVFFIAVSIFPKSILGATIVIKSFLFACEIGTLFLLKRLSKDSISEVERLGNFKSFLNVSQLQTPLIYAFNPLIIIELVGNVHFEAAMIFFFLLAIYILKKATAKRATVKVALTNDAGATFTVALLNIALAAVVWSLSISAKLLTIMLLPLVWRELGWKKSLQFWLLVLVSSLILFIPIYNDLFVNNIMASIKLYSNKFEFNASLFYLIQTFFYWKTGWNKIEYISPYLTAAVVLFIVYRAFLRDFRFSDLTTFKKLSNLTYITPRERVFDLEDFMVSCLFVLMFYFMCATTVHPWYAAMPLACSIFTKWRFPMVWTFTIFLTYHGYTEGSSKHTENFSLVGIEYLAVLVCFLFELYQHKKSIPLL